MTADHVAMLARELRGPRRVKRRLLREAADGLADAAEAYRAAGLDEADAEARAVDEFGTVAAVQPAFQAVLDRATARRAAIVGLCLFPLLTLFWNVAWEQNPYATWQPASVPFLVAVAASLVALAVSLGATVVLVAGRRPDGGWTWRRVDRRAHLFTIAGTWAFAVAVATVPITNPEAVLWPPTALVVLAAATLGLLAVPVCRPSAPGAGC